MLKVESRNEEGESVVTGGGWTSVDSSLGVVVEAGVMDSSHVQDGGYTRSYICKYMMDQGHS